MGEYLILIVIGWHIISSLLSYRERQKLLDRIMAKNYQEYEYYEKKYDKDLKEVEQLRDEAREDRTIETEIKEEEDPNTQRILDAFDEDWDSGEIDKTKISKIVEE